jgi:LacI family transcriptional regulator
MERVTIRDVAAAAGVSYQTVSRVLNDKPDVANETRRRVWQVIEELGYQPSAVARSLVSKKTHTLGLITADFSDYFFTQVIIGAEVEARRSGYFRAQPSRRTGVSPVTHRATGGRHLVRPPEHGRGE